MNKNIFHFFISMNLAVTLLIMLAIASVIGTLIPQNLPLQDYLVRFGPFWTGVFNHLGVFNVYTSGWFTALLLFLVFSLTLCFTEHLIVTLRQRRQTTLNDTSSTSPTCLCNAPPAALINFLKQQGLKTNQMQTANGTMLTAHTKSWRRLGYFLLHGGILVILLGALIDTNPLLRLQLLTGQVKPAPFTQLPEEATPDAILPPHSGAFRATLSLRPGEKSKHVYLTTGTGYLIRQLPFVIAIDDFQIDYYHSGMPKGYTTRVSLFTPDGQLLRRDSLSVNHPLTHEGYTLYQSTFDDGGSIVSFTARQPGGRTLHHTHLQVGESMEITLRGQHWRLTLLDFQMHTVSRRRGGKTINLGPRMVYRLTDPTGQQLWLENYLTPRQDRNGRPFAILGIKHTPNAPFRTIAVPLHDNQDSLFWKWLAQLASMTGESQQSLLIRLFMMGGFDEIERFVEQNVEASEQQFMKKLYLSMVLETLNTTLNHVHPAADTRWRNDAIMAADALFALEVPLWLQMTAFEQRLETGLIVAHYPGKPLIWLGSLLLVTGVFLMLYAPRPLHIRIHQTAAADMTHPVKTHIMIHASDQTEKERIKRQLTVCCQAERTGETSPASEMD